jgi:hypothetical protein
MRDYVSTNWPRSMRSAVENTYSGSRQLSAQSRTSRLCTWFPKLVVFLFFKNIQRAYDQNKNIRLHLQSMENLNRLAQSDQTGLIPDSNFLETSARTIGAIQDGSTEYDQKKGQDYIENIVKGYGFYAACALRVLTNRRLILTEDGYVGLGPQLTSIGDTIWVVPQCSVLFAMREAETAPTGSGIQAYRLMGEVYVHGFNPGTDLNEHTKLEEICIV